MVVALSLCPSGPYPSNQSNIPENREAPRFKDKEKYISASREQREKHSWIKGENKVKKNDHMIKITIEISRGEEKRIFNSYSGIIRVSKYNFYTQFV